MVTFEKFETVSFISSIMKNIVVFPSQAIFLVKLICCIVFGSASSCLLKSTAISWIIFFEMGII